MTDNMPTINFYTPVIDEFNTNTNLINIAENFTDVTVSIEIWPLLTDGDLVELLLDDVDPVDPDDPDYNKYPPATVAVDSQIALNVPGTGKPALRSFTLSKSLLTVGTHKIRYRTSDRDTNNPIGRSQFLHFKVINDPDAVGLKLDITTGAAGFSDSFTNLLPANIAVVRGKPGTRWHARGQGKVQIYEAFGSDNSVIEIDPDGTCPITLMKIDQLDIGTARAMLAGDALSITKENSTEVLLAQPVVFGDYKAVPSDATSKFISYSYNNLGIADGRTETIFSVKLANSIAGEKLFVRMANTLGFVDKSREVNTASRAVLTSYEVDIVDNTSEFGITSTQAGTFTISISTTFDDVEFSQDIEFRNLG
ncbi:MAG: hypothetical protein LBE54_08365 [Brucellaceae bacterium]|jgi:hypothetical protein|nr:hypothetical protein [Brucellaceae bacterium]